MPACLELLAVNGFLETQDRALCTSEGRQRAVDAIGLYVPRELDHERGEVVADIGQLGP
jgi:hypothetical protein